MKYRITTAYVLSGLFLPIALVFAQEKQHVDDIVAKMKTRSSLTQEQVVAVRPIIEEYIDKCQHLMQSSGQFFINNRRKAIQSQINQLREEESEKLSKILTSEQMRKWIQGENVKSFLNQDENDNPDRAPDGKNNFGLGNNF